MKSKRSRSKRPPAGDRRRPDTAGPADANRKSGDFLLGMFGLPALQVVFTIFMATVLGRIATRDHAVIFFWVTEGLFTFGAFALPRLVDRPRIARGYLAAILILGGGGLLLFGACYALLRPDRF